MDFLTAQRVAMPWAYDAACRDEPQPSTFFPDRRNTRTEQNGLSSPATLLPLLICAECPVRRECLIEGLTPKAVPIRNDYEAPGALESLRLVWTLDHPIVGIWGGSTEDERRLAINGRSIEAAAALLEATFERRLAKRISTYRVSRIGGARSANRWTKRVDPILAEREASIDGWAVNGP